MNWAVFVPIIAEHGFDFALRLWSLKKRNEPPTDAEWNELRMLSKKTAADYLSEAQDKVS